MRRLSLALLVALSASGIPARAQEPLLLHIRPNNVPLPDGAGPGERLSDAERAARAMAARDAVWQRAERRARIAIASVCTGCLSATAPAGQPSPTIPGIATADATPPDPRPRTEGDL